MSKNKKIVELKVGVLDDTKKRVEGCFTLMQQWCNNQMTDKAFSTLMMQKLDVLKDYCDTLKKRSIRFGSFDENVAAKQLHKTVAELAPKFKCKISEDFSMTWDKLTKNQQKLLIATTKKVLETLTTK